MFGGKSKPEIDAKLALLIGASGRRARALSVYHQADADVARLRAELLDLVAGSQHEVSVHLVRRRRACRSRSAERGCHRPDT